MKQALFNDWIAALRSDRFGQCKGKLSDGAQGRCCLGVLLEVAGEPIHVYGYILPQTFADEVGMRVQGQNFHDSSLALSAMNDKTHTFAQIADELEANPLSYIKELTP
jgi:hypothetical protein